MSRQLSLNLNTVCQVPSYCPKKRKHVKKASTCCIRSGAEMAYRRASKKIEPSLGITNVLEPSEEASCVPGSKLLILGMVIPPWIWNLYNRYINPYYWVDDHPLLCGNTLSLDPGTCWNPFLIAFSSKIMRWHRQTVFMTSIWHASSIGRQAGLYKQFCSCHRWGGTFQSWILLNLICELLLMVQISQTTIVWMYPKPCKWWENLHVSTG